MFNTEILALAEKVLDLARSQGQMIATAESCTGGLIAGALTEIAGSSDVVDRGFITYSNEAKNQMLDVSSESLARFGAVSEAVAKEMAYGAIAASRADVSVAVTGIAGPGGGSAEKPVGLVCFGLCRIGESPIAQSIQFGDIGRSDVRRRTVLTALEMLHDALST
ncbi:MULTISPECIES: CinA family protein [Kordiimonas]|jgi:nicotinamide-nucleotide amidase|uniref:Nicotinamide-nucleotide amidase n=1 Tax=Kordiimonas lacus TaxID=637679 RepID=A0A1G6WG19_9PROT|nr:MULTISPECIES: CinA family protein [Kordiimonas]SDD64792.1 nicotinamide-nucleotide amidase [Kordiimonas lacus]